MWFVYRERKLEVCVWNQCIITGGVVSEFCIGVRQTQTADWQVNEVNIVVECFNRFSIPNLKVF